MSDIKQYHCATCGEQKPLKEFYTVNTDSGKRASTHCIECNSQAVALNRYKKEIRTNGAKAFVRKIKQREAQHSLMLRALSEVQQ